MRRNRNTRPATNGRALDFWMDGDRLVITIDCSPGKIEAAEPSSSGKTRIVAKTGGFIPVGNVKFGLNVVVPR